MSKAPSLALQGMAARINSLEKPEYDIGEVLPLNLSDIEVHPQVRRPISKESVKGLASTIKREGQRQPVEVYQKDGRFVLVSGERRYRALQQLGRDIVEAKIVAEPTSAELVYLQLTENTEHEPLTVIEIAQAVKALFALNETGQTISVNLNLGGRDVASRLRKIGEGSEQLPALFYDHGISDQRLLYSLAQLEDRWPSTFKRLYPDIVDRSLGRAEVTSWLNHLKENGEETGEAAANMSTSAATNENVIAQPEQRLNEQSEKHTEGEASHVKSDPVTLEPGDTDTKPDSLDPGVAETENSDTKPDVEKAPQAKSLPETSTAANKAPVSSLMDSHYDTSSQMDAQPSGLYVVVKTKLPNGEVINGTLARNKVDSDSAYVWIQPDAQDAPMVKAEAKKLKVVSVTAS